VLVSDDARFFADAEIGSAASKLPHTGARPWTDDFSDLIEYLD
jgi:hypothetical protein